MTRSDGLFLCAAIFVSPHMDATIAEYLSGACLAIGFLGRWIEARGQHGS